MRLLVIEDDKETQYFLKQALEEDCFAVDVSEDGGEGFYLAQAHDYDLIILDNILPQKSGFTICQELREAGKQTPIIILSAKTELLHKLNLLNCGADDYLTKPFFFHELSARIRAILRRPREVHDTHLEVDDLRLEPAKHTVFRGSKRIRLTRKEFTLLHYLMRYQGTVIAKRTLFQHVWDCETNPYSNTLEAHILNLRRKIDGGRKKLISTVPGHGYKIEAA